MEKIILIKYGQLEKNISHKLKNISVKIHKNRSFMQIEFNEKDFKIINEKLSKIFGIHAYQVASVVNTNIESLDKEILSIAKEKNFKTFKVETKRSLKNF